jgi:CRP/FNR family cyclic AMP-dependent transcriptional regulator
VLAPLVGQSFLSTLPAELACRVVEGGHRLEIPSGSVIARQTGDVGVGLVLEGLIRVFLESSGGRQVTVRYARPGEALGLVHLVGPTTLVRAQAVTSVSLWVMGAARLRELAAESAPLAMAIAQECACRAADVIEELSLLTFGSVRQRVARHLLDLAATQQHDGALIAAVTQQQLADAVGSVREVVARVLKQLHDAGLTAGCDGGVSILDAAALDVEATTGSSV